MKLILPQEKCVCAFCKFWVGNAQLSFMPGKRIQFEHVQGKCREKGMAIKYSNIPACSNFERRADL